MQKALLMASVIIGAFLFQPVNAQVLNDGRLGEDNPDMCPLGGNYAPALGFCFVPSTESITKIYRCSKPGSTPSDSTQFPADNISDALGKCTSHFSTYLTAPIPDSPAICDVRQSNNTTVNALGTVSVYYLRYGWNTHPYCSGTPSMASRQVTVSLIDEQSLFVCPPESSNPNFQVFNRGPYVTEEGYNICYYPSSDPGNDDDCPEGTVGGCEPPEPDCIISGNGMEVCKEDPNEKCDSTEQNGQTVYFNCEAGCGFVNDQFLCTTEPDSDGEIPDLSDCFKVGSSWACPSDPPTPDDNIDDPQKPINDMTKGDFKQVQRGVETRLDGTNKLLGDIAGIGKATGEGIEDLNAKALAANKKLDDIIKNTGKTAENLEGDGLELDTNYIDTFKGAFGITGDESIDDLTKTEITLDQFRSEFQWTGGNSSCPPPRSIQIIGQTFSMNWEPFCTAFNVIGYLILAAAYFLSIRIAFGGRY